MNDFWATIIAVLISFLIGIFLMAWFTRGFIGPYLKARRRGVLLFVHNKDGMTADLKAARLEPDGLLKYKEGKEKYVVSPIEGSVIRAARVYMMSVPRGDTAPFVWKKLVPLEEDGEKKMVMFQGYNDSAVIGQAIEWALMKPKRKIPGLGIDLTTLLIILVGIALVVFFIMQQSGGAGGSVI